MTTQEPVKDLLLRRGVPATHSLHDFTVDAETGCWITSHRRKGSGYATGTSFRGRRGSLYRLMYELWYEVELPRGDWSQVLDHLCDNGPGGCINPEHLRVCSQKENTLRSTNGQPCADKARQTHCSKGHEFTPENTRIVQRKKGHASRICVMCANERQERWFANNRERARELSRQNYERAKADPARLEKMRARGRRSKEKKRAERMAS